VVDLRGDQALYRDRLRLSRKQALGALLYGATGAFAGLLMIALVFKDLWQEGPRYGWILVTPLFLPFGIGILLSVIGTRVARNAIRQAVRESREGEAR
jgi:hypothetical protein